MGTFQRIDGNVRRCRLFVTAVLPAASANKHTQSHAPRVSQTATEIRAERFSSIINQAQVETLILALITKLHPSYV